MRRAQRILCILLAASSPAFGQRFSVSPSHQKPDGCSGRMSSMMAPAVPHPAAFADPNIDVTYYRLNLTITGSPDNLSGSVMMNAVSLVDSLTSIGLDLMNTMTVDSVIMAGSRVPFEQFTAVLLITLDRPYRRGELATTEVHYHGMPSATGFGSFEFSSHAGTPWIWSLSEPYGARDWWPCKDHPSDKADSVDVRVTCDSSFKVGSNGRLESVTDNGDGTRTFNWSERYPIATYLVSVALTNYAEFSEWFHPTPTDSMQVLNYVLPEHLADARATAPLVVAMLSIYSDAYGIYPFIREKYGHSEFGLGGAMEHQTMTSTTSFDEDVLAHELAHQWFGDLITCANWSSIWLNEGFASYSEAVYFGREYGQASYWSHVTDRMSTALTAKGSIYVRDTSSVRTLFDPALVYAKGESVLHMLRHILGDSTFFTALRTYVADPGLRYNVATTEDFQRVCEEVSGKQLGYFFGEWIYGESYPQYDYRWSAGPSGGGFIATVTIDQVTATTNPSFFVMPVDFRFSCPGWDTTVVLFNALNHQRFSVPLSHTPTTAVLDPDHWILRDFLGASVPPPGGYSLEQNYPNPFNGRTTIPFLVAHQAPVSICIFNVLGEEVATLLNDVVPAGSRSVTWDGKTGRGIAATSGVYFYRMVAGSITQSRAMLLIR